MISGYETYLQRIEALGRRIVKRLLRRAASFDAKARNIVSTLLLVTAFVAFGNAQNSVIVSEEFTWQYQSTASHKCETFKHTLVGPGILTIRTKMKPFYYRDLGMSREDILTHSVGYFAESLGQTINGVKGADIKDFDGKTVDRISRWKIDRKNYNAEFKVCNPVKCNFAGDCSQFQATATIVIDYAPSSASPVAVSGGTNPNITGTWIVISGGKVVDRLDVSVLGEGYKVEARAGDSAPIYWSGFGVLQGGRLIIATRNTSTGVSGLVIMTPNGDRVHYRSYYLDGRQAWDGEFIRRR